LFFTRVVPEDRVLAPTRLDQTTERFLELLIHHIVHEQVDPLEDGLVEEASALVISAAVELLRIFEQVQDRLHNLSALDELGVHAGQI